MNYFIVGLPRSRTAWLAAFMRQSSKHCLHDGFNGCNNLIEYWDKLEDGGDSSTGLGIIDINRLKPGSPVVVIEKNKDELEHCIEWCSNTYNFNAKAHLIKLHEKLKRIKGLHIQQSEIDDNLENIWTHLVSDEWDERFAEMKELIIQVKSTEIDIEAAINFKGGL